MHVPVFLSVYLLPLLMHLEYQIFLILHGENIFQKHPVFYMKSCITCYHRSFQSQIYLILEGQKMYFWYMLLLSARMGKGRNSNVYICVIP